MLSIRNFHVIKYLIIIILYQVQFYFDGSSYSLYLLVLNITFLGGSSLGAVLLNGKSNKLFLKLNRSDLLVLVFFFGYLASFIKGVLSINSFIVMVFYLVLIWVNIKIDSEHNPSLFNSYVKSIVMIMIINMILFLIGISSSSLINKYPEMQIRLVELIGLNLNRFNFFIFSNFAYTSMLYCIPLIVFQKRSKKLLNLLVILLAAISLILLDARGPFLAAICVIIFGRFLYDKSINKQLIFVSVIAIIPLITNTILILLNLDDAEALSLLSRRDAIWNITISNYSPDLFELIFGFGYIGQYSSGISELYSNLFPGYGNQEQISVHNSYLQILLDYGLLGLVLLFVTIRKLIKRFKEKNKITPFLVLLFLLICGVTDLSIQPNNINMLTAFLVIANSKFV
ncbi:MAG: O-antigen ligase family protein [Oceanospirillaceae bacterium]|nr:O-antigen ligase family protein [Oceanospirillaceae bacterium]